MKRLVTVLWLLVSIAGLNAQDIVSAEYFFDSDPGVGNGTSITISSPGPVVNFSANIPVNGLSAGFHFLAIRAKDADGKWTLYEQRGFYLSTASADMPVITAAEYFYDNDPGPGNGTALIINTPGTIVTQNFAIPVPAGMSQGDHFLTIRVKDQAGNWSLFEQDTLTIENTATISCPGNITVSASVGQCTAVVNNIDAIVAPQGSSYTYMLSGATTGSGSGTASGKTFNTGVTTVTYALTSSPSTTCSFAVTVNSTTAPSVTITAPTTTTCPGSALTFTATPTNGGPNPTYQWKKNGIDFGNGTNILQSNVWANGDVVTVVMTSSSACANPVSDTSNAMTVSVIPPYITPTISITSSTTTICPGTAVTFFATQTNGGVPSYGWYINGIWAGPGTDYNSFETSSLQNGDKVKCVLTSSLACVTDVTTVSNEITMTVLPVLAPTVTITASSDTICAGTPVFYTATSTNGGSAPYYEWMVNGNVVQSGTNDSTFEYWTVQHNDVVKVRLASSLWCTNPQVVTSNSIAMTVLQSTPAFVNISASQTTICAGQSVTFSVTVVSPGATYQWQLNGNNIAGATGATYQSSSLQHGQKIRVVMIPASPCAIPSPAISNEITITVNGGAATVTIAASQTTICAGQLVTFTSTITNGGTDPTYEWTRNGNVVGSDTSVYQTTTLQDGDIVRLTMQPYGSCAGNAAVYSNTITISVGSGVNPAVTIAASAIDICAGTPVTFTATPTNGGINPHYQWKLNGNNVGGDSAIFHSSTLANADTVRVVMTSSLSCVSATSAISNYISMDVSSPVVPSVNIVAENNAVCTGTVARFTAYAVNGGNQPSYQWKLNGNNVGMNSALYENSGLVNGDKVQVVITSSLPCAVPATAESNIITMTILQTISYYKDLDADGFGSASSGTLQACGPQNGYVTNNDDCNDSNNNIHPGATEVCDNGIDDNCDGTIDENCTAELPVLLVKTYPVKEGDAGYTILNVEVKLDHPGLSPVNINYSTSNANATAGSDYVAAGGVLTIPVGAVSGTVQIRIIGDLLPEHNESFWLDFSNPVNVVLGTDPRARIMIIDDDKGKPTSITKSNELAVEQLPFKIPTVVKRNNVWLIPQIGNYENEVLIVNIQGQTVTRYINYKNQTAIGNVAAGLYFYRIRIAGGDGQYKHYSGRLLITE